MYDRVYVCVECGHIQAVDRGACDVCDERGSLCAGNGIADALGRSKRFTRFRRLRNGAFVLGLFGGMGAATPATGSAGLVGLILTAVIGVVTAVCLASLVGIFAGEHLSRGRRWLDRVVAGTTGGALLGVLVVWLVGAEVVWGGYQKRVWRGRGVWMETLRSDAEGLQRCFASRRDQRTLMVVWDGRTPRVADELSSSERGCVMELAAKWSSPDLAGLEQVACPFFLTRQGVHGPSRDDPERACEWR